jgi:hypothetical protein
MGLFWAAWYHLQTLKRDRFSLCGLVHVQADRPNISLHPSCLPACLMPQRFVDNKPYDAHPTRNLDRVKATAGGQKPFAAFLSCADSRVPVEIVFDQG